MGTSVSQPSPTSSSEGGKSWKKVVHEVGEKGTNANLLPLVLSAYNAQYAEQAFQLIADKGARVVETVFHALIDSNDVGGFFQRARRELADSGSISLFSEFAITAAASTMTSTVNDKKREFVTSYLNSIVEYVVSRDLTAHFGTAGNPNYTTLDNLISTSKDKINEQTPANATIEATVKSIMGRLNE